MRNTPDGRATIAAVKRSRSYVAAVGKLQFLKDDLVNLLRDTREDYYRESFATMSRIIPAQHHRTVDPQPTLAGISAVRGAPIQNSLRLETFFAVALSDVARRLHQTLAVASMRSQPQQDAHDLIERWAAAAGATLLSSAAAAISNASVHAEREAGRDVVDEDLLLPLLTA